MEHLKVYGGKILKCIGEAADGSIWLLRMTTDAYSITILYSFLFSQAYSQILINKSFHACLQTTYSNLNLEKSTSFLTPTKSS